MRRIITICLLFLSIVLPACSGGGSGGSGDSGTTQTAVVFSLENAQSASASSVVTAEELQIAYITLNISGPEMKTIVKRYNVQGGSTSFQTDIQVPNGKNRLFTADAYNSVEEHRFSGATLVAELTGKPATLSDESFTQLSDGTFRKTIVVQLEGVIPESVCNDNDEDGYGDPGDASCPNGGETDCNDDDPDIHPGADDSNCNGIDENCNGTADEGYVGQETTCGIGVCTAIGTTACVNGQVTDTCTSPAPTTEYTISEVPYSEETLTSASVNLISGDDESVAYALPWDFPFYGENHKTLQITTNGMILLTKDDGNYDGQGSLWANLYDIDLSSANDPEEEINFIPIIVPWNYDLTSAEYGDGITVEVKTNPDRLVIQWYTETYDTEDYDWPNRFEAVLFSDGTIRFDYISFDYDVANSYCFDSGSGVSFGDGYNFTNLTDAYDSACALEGRSFLFTPPCDFGVYVDQEIGTDTAGCGTVVQPCSSITFGLTQTVGHEPIFVNAGTYGQDAVTPESFPIVLKEGTSLLCEGTNHSTVIDLLGTATDEAGIDATALDTHIAGCRIVLNDGGGDNTGGIEGGYGFVLDDTELDGGTDTDYGIELTGSGIIRRSSFTNIPASAF